MFLKTNVLIVLIAGWTFMACQDALFWSKQKSSDKEALGAAQGDSIGYSLTGDVRKFGVRNFRELNRTMQALSGATSDSGKLKSVSSLLPSSNAITNFSATTQIGIYRLAESYCLTAISSWQKDVPPELAPFMENGRADPQGEDPQALATIMIDSYWETDMLHSADRDQLITKLTNFITEHEGYECDAEGVCWSDAKKVLHDVCVGLLASAAITFL